MLAGLHKWWDTRNKANAGEQIPSCLEVAYVVNSMMGDLSEKECKSTCSPALRRTWQRPNQDFLKINIDRGFRQNDETGSLSGIIWESQCLQGLLTSTYLSIYAIIINQSKLY